MHLAPPPLAAVQALFARPPTLVVLGAHPEPWRAAYFVTDYLQHVGATIVPVNPAYAGTSLHGTTVVATLAEARERLSTVPDALVVFRRADALPAHLPEMLELQPRLVWMQLGVQHDSVSATLRAHGIAVVEDRCLKVDHARVFTFGASA